MERKSSRVVLLVLAGHALAAAWTWRDIRRRPDSGRAISPRWSGVGRGDLHGRDEVLGVRQERLHVARVVGVDDRDEQMRPSAV
jgi:hypothetical protein